jgi:hypothetical protein
MNGDTKIWPEDHNVESVLKLKGIRKDGLSKEEFREKLKDFNNNHPINGTSKFKCIEICGRPWKRLNVNGAEIDPNSHEPLNKNISQRDLFGFINALMSIRAEEMKKEDTSMIPAPYEAMDQIDIILMKISKEGDRVMSISPINAKLVELALTSNPDGESVRCVAEVIGKQAADLFLSFMKDLK